MGKDDKCCVPFCGNRRKLKRSLSYFRIPQNPQQRTAWLEILKKDPGTIAANDRVCSVHFVSGKPSPFSQNVDWMPTLCMDRKEGDDQETREQPMNNAKKKVEKDKMKMPTSSMYVSSNTESQQSLNKSFEDPSKMDVTLQQHASHHHHHHHPFQQPQQQAPQAYHQQHFPPHLHHARAHQQYPAHYQSLFPPQSHYQQPPLTHHQLIPHQHHPHLHLQAHHHHHQQQQLPPPPQQPPPPPRQPVPSQQQPPPLQQPPPSHQQPPPPSHQQPPPPSHQQPPPSHQQPPPSQQSLSSLQQSPTSQQPAASQQPSLLPPTLQQLSPSQQSLQQQTQQHMHHSLLHHQQQNQQLHQQHPQQQHTQTPPQQQSQHPQLQQQQQQQHTQPQQQSQHMPTQQESQLTQQHSQQIQQQPLMQQQQPQQLTQQQKSQQHADQQQHSQQHMQQSQQQQTQQHAQQQPQQHMQQMQSQQHLQQHSQSHTSQQQTQQHLQQQHNQTPQQQSQQQQSQPQHSQPQQSQPQQSQPQHSQPQQSQQQHSQQQQPQPQHSQQQQQQQSQQQHIQQQQQSQQQHLQQQQSQQQQQQSQQQQPQQQQPAQPQHSQQQSQQQHSQQQQQQLAQHSQQQQKPSPQQHHSTVQQHSHQDHHQPQTLPQQQPLQQNVCVLCNEKFPTKEALQQHFRTHANSGVRYSRTINHSQSVQSASHPPLLSPPSPICSQSGSSQAPTLSPVFSSASNRNHNAISSNPQSSITNSASTPGLTEKWTCAVCSRIFTTKSSYLTHHMRYHPQETGHHCPHCGRMFPLRADWERHLQTHPNSGPYTPIPCTVCRADFFNQEALHYHMQNHRKVEKITGQTGPDGDLNDVVRPSKRLRIDGMGEPQACYYCPWCGKEYIQRYNLEAHIRKLHKGWTKSERLFHCDMCDSDFYNQSALMQHNFSHQENHGYLINPADMCKVELEEETNLLNQLSQLPLVPSDQSSSSSGDSKQPWPEWMNALPPELLRAIKQEPPSPPPTANNDVFTESGMFPCLECGGQFPTQVVLKQHRCLPGRENPMIKRESRADLTCGVCGCSFKSESELADHLLKLHEVYLCSQCGEELPNRTAYLDHQKWHAGNANNGEEVRIPLNVFLSEKEKMERKMAAAATDNRLKDQEKKNEEKMTESDKKDQANKEQDEKHKKTKNKDDEQFVCGLCDQHFPDQSSLECHFREMGDHVSKNARFSVTCNVCGLSFTLEAFKKHSHSNRASDISSGKSGSGPPNGSIPIKCGICQEDFATKEEIDAHFASHPETERDMSRRSFLCNVCVAEDPALALIASFSTLRELYDHHARQHPQMSSNYQCRLCGMRFFQQWDLASHFAKHLPENIRNQCQVVFKNGQLKATFVCERCDQVFNYEVHLANHLRNNTCLKWACTICGKGHRSAKHRNQHIREAHRDDSLRYVCKVDGCMGRSVFSKRAHVHAHIRSKHPQVLRCGPNGTVEGTPDELDRFVLVESAEACDNSTETEKSSGYCAKEENNKLSVDAKQEKSA